MGSILVRVCIPDGQIKDMKMTVHNPPGIHGDTELSWPRVVGR